MKSKVEIARRIRDNGYSCKSGKVDMYCGGCDIKDACNKAGIEALPRDEDKLKEFVDNYIKRYSRTTEKSSTVDRPNFRKALKDKKEFRVTFKSTKARRECLDIMFELDISHRLVMNDYHTFTFCKTSGIYTMFSGLVRRPIDSEYNTTTDTFSDHIEEEKVENFTDCKHYTPEECLTRIGCEDTDCPHAVTPIIKLKTDCVVLTEEEFIRLKKIEKDYELIKKVLED